MAIARRFVLTTQRAPKGEKWKISYISSVPAANAEYSATNVIPPVGAIAAVKRLLCRISEFVPYISQGAKISSPSVNFGPPHILKTIRATKLKFSTHLDTEIGSSALF